MRDVVGGEVEGLEGGSGDQTLLVSTDGKLLATAEATVAMPLYVLPVLSDVALRQLRRLLQTRKRPHVIVG